MLKKTQRKRSTSRKRSRKTAPLPEKQWDMPAGFHSDESDVATLREVIDPNVPTRQLSDLTLEQRAELVAKRLELQPRVDLMVRDGLVDKARAITEVKAQTKVGKLLIEIEDQMIRNLMERAQKKDAKTSRRDRVSRKSKKRRSTKSH